ncbi:MAG: sulfotransferase [Myxococcota bacterium]|nr:sulfotransferase [Myxococcota bacterium]
MDRFVVGSGRCGSTLLSLMLARHPDVLNLSEFFNGLDMARRFSPEPCTGREFAELIGAEQPVVTAVVRRGYDVSEVVYPFGEPGASYGRADRLPWLLVTLVPRITDRPDAFNEALLARAADFPSQPPVEHYRALFEWIGEQLGRRCWIERSGSSVHYAADLVRAFPEARFVHLHRSGVEVALSMREHHAYRLPISLIYDAPLDDGTRPSELGPIDFLAAPRDGDAIFRVLESRPPPEYFGRYWSDQITAGIAGLQDLGPDRLLTISFDDLVREPRPVLERVAQFFELPAPGGDWLGEASALVRGVPPTRLETLDADQKVALREVCAPAQALVSPE